VIITTDNAYMFGFGDQTEINVIVASVDNCTAAEIYASNSDGAECYTVPANLNGYIYIIGWSDTSAYQGAIAQFSDGGTTVLTQELPSWLPQWEVYATGDQLPVCPLVSPVLTTLNAEILKANTGTGGPGSNRAWVNPSGSVTWPGDGVLAFCPVTNGAAPGTPFPPMTISNFDNAAQWMWYNPYPGVITNPFVEGGYPNFPASDMREYYIFRIGPLGALLEPKGNHFKTWRLEPLPFHTVVDVVDPLMGGDALELDTIEFLSNPVRKDTFAIIKPDDHLLWYEADGRDTCVEVVFQNQFGLDTIVMGTVTHLLLPAQKLPHEAPDSLGHYKAYRVWQSYRLPFLRRTELQDQFDLVPEFIDTLVPAYYCTPASKSGEPIYDSITDYVAYEIFPKQDTIINRTVVDQFGRDSVFARRSELLMVPTHRLAVDPFCSIDVPGDLNCSGTVTSADIISLVNFVFKGGTPPCPCLAAADANCDGTITSTDIIRLVNFVFKGGASPCDPCTIIPALWTCPC
jgi:hypothetical protein